MPITQKAWDEKLKRGPQSTLFHKWTEEELDQLHLIHKQTEKSRFMTEEEWASFCIKRDEILSHCVPPPTEPPAPESVLAEALRVTGGSRQENYGHPYVNHERIAILWNAFLLARSLDANGDERNPAPELEAEDVATMQILLKIARNMHTPKRDNCTDMAGYARCLSQIHGFE
jgi:hypothetical protein